MQRRSFLKWLSAIPLVALLKPAAAKALPPPGSLAAALSACPPGGTVVVLPGRHEMMSVPTETWPKYDEVEALSRRLIRVIARQRDLDAAKMMSAYYNDLDLDA